MGCAPAPLKNKAQINKNNWKNKPTIFLYFMEESLWSQESSFLFEDSTNLWGPKKTCQETLCSALGRNKCSFHILFPPGFSLSGIFGNLPNMYPTGEKCPLRLGGLKVMPIPALPTEANNQADVFVFTHNWHLCIAYTRISLSVPLKLYMVGDFSQLWKVMATATKGVHWIIGSSVLLPSMEAILIPTCLFLFL